MKIAFVIAQMAAGGAERQASMLCNHWAEAGHDVQLATFEDIPDHFRLDDRIVRTRLREGAVPGGSLHGSDHAALSRFFGAASPDAIVAFGDVTNIKVLAAARTIPVPVIVSERTVPFHLWRSRPGPRGVLLALLRRFLYRQASALVVQTRGFERWARRTFFAPRVTVIPNIVASWELPDLPRQKTLLAMGRLSPEKGQDVLIRAFALVAVRWPDWSVRLVGDGASRDALVALVRDLEIRDRVAFVPAVKNTVEEYAAAGIFVLPSRYEGFPNTLIEAMHAGCAAVAADCPLAPREIVTSGVDGLLFRNGNPEALAPMLEALMSDDARRAQIGARAQQTAARYSAERILPLWDELLAGAVARHKQD